MSRLFAQRLFAPTHWLMPAALMEQYFPHVPAALENGPHCRCMPYRLALWRNQFPDFRQLSDGESFDLLKDKTYGGALTRYGTLSVQTFANELSTSLP